MSTSYVIQPLCAIGPVVLGDSLDSVKALGLTYDAALSEDGKKCFQSTDLGLICYLNQDRVQSVACWTSCTYKGLDLIGLGEADLERLLGKPESTVSPVWVTDDRWQKAVEFNKLGLMIWLENGRTVKVNRWWNGEQ